MNHAETLIKVTEEYTLRPRKGDRVNVCIAVLEYLLNNFAYDHETSDEDDCGYAGRYVDAEDIHQLVHEMKKLNGDTMTNTNPRDLIQQLAGLARRKHYTCEDSWYSCPQSEGGSDRNPGAECDCGADEHNAKVDAIWDALSLPEPEGPTVMEIIELADEIEAEDLGQVDLVRRALARCGRPAVEPVPVSKRLPGEEDCDPSFQCWWFTPSEEKWILWPIKWAGPECSHWLPHYALPVPTTETP